MGFRREPAIHLTSFVAGATAINHTITKKAGGRSVGRSVGRAYLGGGYAGVVCASGGVSGWLDSEHGATSSRHRRRREIQLIIYVRRSRRGWDAAKPERSPLFVADACWYHVKRKTPSEFFSRTLCSRLLVSDEIGSLLSCYMDLRSKYHGHRISLPIANIYSVQ